MSELITDKKYYSQVLENTQITKYNDDIDTYYYYVLHEDGVCDNDEKNLLIYSPFLIKMTDDCLPKELQYEFLYDHQESTMYVFMNDWDNRGLKSMYESSSYVKNFLTDVVEIIHHDLLMLKLFQEGLRIKVGIEYLMSKTGRNNDYDLLFTLVHDYPDDSWELSFIRSQFPKLNLFLNWGLSLVSKK